MKKNLLVLSMAVLGLSAVAQTPRLSLFEEFTGETCPPCASTNPGLNIILKANQAKVVAIKWQVPIPSTPTATWSLYKTNKADIDWRYKSSATGYGYPSQWVPTDPPTSGVNSAPQGRLDGQHLWTFGAPSDHGVYCNPTTINAAQSQTAAFSITMNRAWNATGTAITVTVNIQATAPFTAVGPLVFRTVMVEEEIHFATQPGTNGEKDFDDVAIAAFPTLQTGVAMASNWTIGQTQTFTLNCPIPSYTRNKSQVAFVGFIQDDGDRKVAQAVRASKEPMTNDAVAMEIRVPVTCTNTVDAEVIVYNNGATAITAMTITPSSDAVTGPVTNWTGNLAPGAFAVIQLNPIPAAATAGSHIYSYNITAINGGVDFDLSNNTAKVTYVVASSYQGTPVAEGFLLGAYPPAGFTVINPNSGTAGWSRVSTVGAYNLSPLNSSKYDFFNNTVIGDMDELFLPPIDLSGANDPEMLFDVAYAQRTATSADKLEVLASSDCGATWVAVYSSQGAALATATSPYGSNFIPDAMEWRTELFTLPGFNKPNVLVKFVVTNDNGNTLYLDNINLSQTAPVGIAKVSSSLVNVSLYPNPTNGITNVNINSNKAGDAKISVLNQLGQVVSVKTVSLIEGLNSVVLDTKELASGIYNVSIVTTSGSAVKKLNVIK